MRYSIHELGTCRTGSSVCHQRPQNPMTILSLSLLASAYLAEQMRARND
jgi:hypothetical protein